MNDNNVLLMRYNGGFGALTLAIDRPCIFKQLVAGTVPVFRHLLCFPATVCVREKNRQLLGVAHVIFLHSVASYHGGEYACVQARRFAQSAA